MEDAFFFKYMASSDNPPGREMKKHLLHNSEKIRITA